MESLFDPERLHDRDGVSVTEETTVVHREEFDAVREDADSHAAVGVTNDAGEVLLLNDGSHGWTLTAFPVEDGSDWVATVRRGVETVAGVAVDLVRPERVRRLEFRPEGARDRRTVVYNVVFRAASVDGRPIGDDLEDGQEIGWFDEVPGDQTGDLADDIRLFVE